MRIAGRLVGWTAAISREPPIRQLSRMVVKALPFSVRTKAAWDVVARPHYLIGVLAAADEAQRQDRRDVSVIEFGVAGGNGLLALQKYAAEVERESGVTIRVFGFDSGHGLPEPYADYRDHIDHYRAGDYPMDPDRLRPLLASRTELILGDIRETVSTFAAMEHPPVGFMAVDVDFYSSTTHALTLLSAPSRNTLPRTYLYFDDTDDFAKHRAAGELLAIDEFNAHNAHVKIDRWRGLATTRVFPHRAFLTGMYIAHDLDALSRRPTPRADPSRDLALRA